MGRSTNKWIRASKASQTKVKRSVREEDLGRRREAERKEALRRVRTARKERREVRVKIESGEERGEGEAIWLCFVVVGLCLHYQKFMFC